MYFPYFGKFSYYGIFRENNTILDICFLFKALERRKNLTCVVLHFTSFIFNHHKKRLQINISPFLLIFVKIRYFDNIFWGSKIIFKSLLMQWIYSIHHYTKIEYINSFFLNQVNAFFLDWNFYL